MLLQFDIDNACCQPVTIASARADIVTDEGKPVIMNANN